MLMDGNESSTDALDLNDSYAKPEKRTQGSGNSTYDNLFE
jgi:hypothetical protein